MQHAVRAEEMPALASSSCRFFTAFTFSSLSSCKLQLGAVARHGPQQPRSTLAAQGRGLSGLVLLTLEELFTCNCGLQGLRGVRQFDVSIACQELSIGLAHNVAINGESLKRLPSCPGTSSGGIFTNGQSH
eukprot:Skav234671  [mRNA]  locus=scaffold1131:459664:463957:+ [translate_table: standard]